MLNTRGFHRAAATGVDEVNCVVSVTDEFSQANQGMTSEQAIAVVAEVVPLARAAGILPTVTLSVAFGCPFSGEVSVDRVRRVVEQVAATGVAEVAIADTIGVAVPRDVTTRVAAVRDLIGDLPLRAHFHNTRNTGYANALAAADAGVSVLDASLGGIGGCPFAPRATGNIATEDLVYALHRSGYDDGRGPRRRHRGEPVAREPSWAVTCPRTSRAREYSRPVEAPRCWEARAASTGSQAGVSEITGQCAVPSPIAQPEFIIRSPTLPQPFGMSL